MALDFYQQLAADLVRDDAGKITPEQVDVAIAEAVARLSDDLPRTRMAEVTGASGQRLNTPADWVPGESRVVDIEYPVGYTPPRYLAADSVLLVDAPDGTQQIGLADALPAASTVRIRYTLPHEVSGQADTVPVQLRWGVAALAASLLCGQLASAYANQRDSTIAADSVEQKSRSELYAAREREYLKQAYTSWGLPVPGSKGAGASDAKAAGVQVSFGSRRGTAVERGLRWS